jgi:uncharacterized membrane protein (UPF0127 family)
MEKLPTYVPQVRISMKLLILLMGCLMCGAPGAQSVLVEREDGVAVHFQVELATTAQQRSQGLMFRRALPPRHGMWFDFESDGAVVMWMKDTLVPLDMLFIASDGLIVGVHEHAEPHSLARIAAPRPVRYVLEINAGEAQRYAVNNFDRARLLLR